MLWVKSLHVISVIAWMAALLYLPRLMVYHAESTPGSEKSETFKVMERRLLKGIATPAMAASWVFGLWMAWLIGAWGDGWFYAKLFFVLLLSGYHGVLARWVRTFAADRNVRPARFYRIANEVPTLLMIAIVILAVVKPF
jgi:protoporphyrinogen IX oxidase